MLTCLVTVLFTFYIQGELKLKKNNSGAKGLRFGRSLKRLRAFAKRALKKSICAYGRGGNRRLEKTAYCGTSCFAPSFPHRYYLCEKIKENRFKGGGGVCGDVDA